MLLPFLYFVADGKPQSCMLQHLKMADVITILADGIATGQLILFYILWCLTEPHPKYVADGICLCFYLGMDY